MREAKGDIAMDGSVNKVTLVGRLTEDPKAKRTAGGSLWSTWSW